MSDDDLAKLRGELSEKAKHLIRRERDVQQLIRQVGASNRWIETSASLTSRIGTCVKESSAIEELSGALAEELGFEYACVQWGELRSECPPLDDDGVRQRVHGLLELRPGVPLPAPTEQAQPPSRAPRMPTSVPAAGRNRKVPSEPVQSYRWADGPIRLAYRITVSSEITPDEQIVIVVARSERTAIYSQGSEPAVAERLRLTRSHLEQAFDAVRLRRDLVRERDSLKTSVDEATANLRLAVDEAEAARNDALRSARARTEFLANMSHEIRTPMTAILGYAELLVSDGVASPARRQYAETIQKSARHLMAVLDDILNFARIDSGRMELEEVENVLPQVFFEVHSLLGVRAAEKGLELDLIFGTPIPERAIFDAGRLRQILINLLGNSLKFTSRGGVKTRVSVVLLPEEESGERTATHELHVAVEDTGSGIAQDKLCSIFEAFEQENKSTSRIHGGTGLGLAISQRLARLMGGTIRVTSAVGEGSTFELIVPVVALGSKYLSSPAACTMEGSEHPIPTRITGRVLVVDDTAVNRTMFATILQRAGAAVDVATDGSDALVKIGQAEAIFAPYDLVFLDMQMPVLDGYETARQLRAQGSTVTVVALTAHAMATDRDLCISAGCTEFLTKPVTREALLTMASRFLTSRASVHMERIVTDDVIAELMGEFLEEYTNTSTELSQAVAGHQTARAAELAHRLKGAAATFGFPDVSEAAGAVERAARSGDTDAMMAAFATMGLAAAALPFHKVQRKTII